MRASSGTAGVVVVMVAETTGFAVFVACASEDSTPSGDSPAQPTSVMRAKASAIRVVMGGISWLKTHLPDLRVLAITNNRQLYCTAAHYNRRCTQGATRHARVT